MAASEPAVALPVAIVLAYGPKKLMRHYRWPNREKTLCGKVIEDGALVVAECADCYRCEELRASVEQEIGEILEKWRRWHGLPD